MLGSEKEKNKKLQNTNAALSKSLADLKKKSENFEKEVQESKGKIE